MSGKNADLVGMKEALLIETPVKHEAKSSATTDVSRQPQDALHGVSVLRQSVLD